MPTIEYSYNCELTNNATMGIHSPLWEHWRRQPRGTGARAPPSAYNNLIFQCTLTYTKSDSDYDSHLVLV